MHRRCAFAVGLAALAQGGAFAQSEQSRSEDELRLEQIVVVRAVVPGSATVIDEVELERFDHIDLGQVLAAHPGVYMREEDGYGLRPNIGIRGAAAERSQKITLLEDGAPIAPAPYSAPAAYYMPNVSRLQAVEVLKGPAAIAHGPHTVGGAINFVTRAVPSERLAELDASVGSNGFHKLAATFGAGKASAAGERGLLIEALRYGSDGFKNLDGGGDTGFARNDLSAKLHWAPAGARRQRLTLRVGMAEEDANETYLGLADADFRKDPRRRYAASQRDAFRSRHVGGLLSYGIDVGADGRIDAKAYWNDFERQWNKLDGFIAGRALQTVLARPERYRQANLLLAGAVDSIATATQTLDVTDSDRAYLSRGLQLTATATLGDGALSHFWTVGVRAHRDEVARDHQPRGYLMQSGRMAFDGIARRPKLRNRADSRAVAVHVSDEIAWRDFKLTIGARFEDIDGRFENRRDGEPEKTSAQRVLAPGVGLHWQASERIGLLAGVHRGFSPAGPGSQADAERSLNVEYGLRYRATWFDAELLGFFSDYGNLLGRCRVSDAGCEAGDEFNAGRVEVSGAELAASARHELGGGARVSAQLAYTYTDSAFRSGFLSGFSQWGLVEEGDELPYLPPHHAHLRLGLTKGPWDLFAAVKARTPMREEPGSGPVRDGLHADRLTTLDLTATWRIGMATLAQVVIGNVTNEAAIVSHRPYGARPNRPRWLTLRLRHSF